jgi:hypothetical protein
MMLSVDCATTSGVAVWDKTGLLSARTLRPVGKGPTWAHWAEGVKVTTYLRRWNAWNAVAMRTIVAAVERGANRSADRSLGRSLGYLEAVADSIGATFVTVELSTWRRAISEEMAERGTPITWPKGESKRVAIDVAKALYPQLGEGVTDDEAEAVLIGHAARRLRLVTP